VPFAAACHPDGIEGEDGRLGNSDVGAPVPVLGGISRLGEILCISWNEIGWTCLPDCGFRLRRVKRQAAATAATHNATAHTPAITYVFVFDVCELDAASEVAGASLMGSPTSCCVVDSVELEESCVRSVD
jgi:hypothetical protein